MKVRVTVYLDKPLKRKIKFKKTDSDWMWITVKYENVEAES